MLGRHCGMRPKEIVSLRWSDVNIMDMGQRSTKDDRKHLIAEINVRKTKTGEPRQVPARCGKPIKEWLEYHQFYTKTYY